MPDVKHKWVVRKSNIKNVEWYTTAETIYQGEIKQEASKVLLDAIANGQVGDVIWVYEHGIMKAHCHVTTVPVF